MLTSRLIAVIKKKKAWNSENKVLPVRFRPVWFGVHVGTIHYIFEWRPLLDVTYFIYSLFFQESFLFKSVKTNAAYSVVQSPTCSKLPTLYYWNIFDPFNLIILGCFSVGRKIIAAHFLNITKISSLFYNLVIQKLILVTETLRLFCDKWWESGDK